MLESKDIRDARHSPPFGSPWSGAAFFRIEVSAVEFSKALTHGSAQVGDRSAFAGYLIALGGDGAAADRRLDGKLLPALPFPDGLLALARLLDSEDPEIDAAPGVALYFERSVFDRLADEYGCDRIEHLAVAGDRRKHPILRNLAECLDADARRGDDLDRAYTGHILRAITIYLAAEFGGLAISPPPVQGGLRAWQLRFARRRLAAGVAGGVSLEEVARGCGLSLNHFSRAFRQSTGVSPHRWILRRRIVIARQMMRTTQEPLAQIAAVCGFSDQSHLHRVFTSIMGTTPHKWRTGDESSEQVN